MPGMRCCLLNDIRSNQVARCDVMQSLRQSYVLFTIISQGFGYHHQYQPSAKALWLIMGSRVDTSGGNQNAVR